jgi:hypothetical protein
MNTERQTSIVEQSKTDAHICRCIAAAKLQAVARLKCTSSIKQVPFTRHYAAIARF